VGLHKKCPKCFWYIHYDSYQHICGEHSMHCIMMYNSEKIKDALHKLKWLRLVCWAAFTSAKVEI